MRLVANELLSGADHVLAHKGSQDLGYVDQAIGSLVVFHDGDHARLRATAVPLSVWTKRVPFWPDGR